MAKPLGPKSIAIRDVLKNHATMGNKEVAELLTNRHPDLKVTPQDVANQRTALGKLARGERDEEEGPVAAQQYSAQQQYPAQQTTVPNYLTGQTTAAPVAAAPVAAAPDQPPTMRVKSAAIRQALIDNPTASAMEIVEIMERTNPDMKVTPHEVIIQKSLAKSLAIREAIDDNPTSSANKIVEIVERTHPDMKVTFQEVASQLVADYEEAKAEDETQFTAQLRALVQLLGKETVKRMVDSL